MTPEKYLLSNNLALYGKYIDILLSSEINPMLLSAIINYIP